MTRRQKQELGFPNRRDFIKESAGSMVVSFLGGSKGLARTPAAPSHPWYRRTYRWGQTNINEKDPLRYGMRWWREHWKRTRVQGVVINAGGIVAYYPSRFSLHYRPPALGNRDLYGELVEAAHEDGMVVLARMDSDRAHENFFEAQPGWFAKNREGEPYRAGDLYITCINSPYYEEYLPEILRAG